VIGNKRTFCALAAHATIVTGSDAIEAASAGAESVPGQLLLTNRPVFTSPFDQSADPPIAGKGEG